MTARAQEVRAGLAFLRAADPVLAQLIDDRPHFDPDAFVTSHRRLLRRQVLDALRAFRYAGTSEGSSKPPRSTGP